jgi:hypothetical protein
MQHLLSRASVDDGQMLDTIAAWVAGHLAGDAVDTVLIVDQTGFLKERHAVGGRAAPIQLDRRAGREFPARNVLPWRTMDSVLVYPA